ncbi:MAG: CNNM domain-containing protein [Planctomycetaceae bacterium]|nr:CNNM domain-containing protein [Planctomycetaceae bacterium]
MIYIYEIIIIVVMLVFNAIFAAYEMAIASVTSARLEVLRGENKKGANEAVFMKNNMEASLAVIQLGITLAGAFAAATGGAGIGESLTPYLVKTFGLHLILARTISIIFLIIPYTFIVMVFGELVPKMLALKNKERIILLLSPHMKRLATVVNPIISIIEVIVKRLVSLVTSFSPLKGIERTHGFYDFRAAVSLARASKLLNAHQEKIVLSSALLSIRPVKEIIIPAQDIAMVWSEDSLMEALVRAHLDMHTRFPTCRVKNDPQTIEGYINFKDIVYALKTVPADPSLKGIVRTIKKIDGEHTISQAMEKMIQEKLHIAVVTGKDGKIMGMVTLEDILEELVGEIEDEFDYLPTHISSCGSDCWIMGGGLPMSKVYSTLGRNFAVQEGEKMPTLNEWIMQRANRELEGGEVIEADNVRVVVRKFRRKKISEALVGLKPQPQP